MRPLVDILTLAPQIAAGTPTSEEPEPWRQDIGRLIDHGPEAALACLDAVVSGPFVAEALDWLEGVGALGVWLPEVQALKGFHESSPVHHKDLWAHTLEVVQRTPADADLRWVALLHDIGKVATRALSTRGQVSFHGHERLGAWLSLGIAGRLGMAPARSRRIAFIVEHHARVNAYDSSWSDRAVRRLIRDAGEHLEDMLRFSNADYTTKRAKRASKIRARLCELSERIETLMAKARVEAPLPSGFGRTLCEAMRMKPGPEVGSMIRWLEGQIDEGVLEAGRPAEFYIAALRTQGRDEEAKAPLSEIPCV